MIVTETITINGKDFTHNYSNSGFWIKKQGTEELYEYAIDIPEHDYVYIETDRLIEVEDDNDNPS